MNRRFIPRGRLEDDDGLRSVDTKSNTSVFWKVLAIGTSRCPLLLSDREKKKEKETSQKTGNGNDEIRFDAANTRPIYSAPLALAEAGGCCRSGIAKGEARGWGKVLGRGGGYGVLGRG